jgi:hypothetical protein
MHQSTQQFYNKQINTTVLEFVYCLEVLLPISTLLGHHQAIITWICHSLLGCLPMWIQIGDLYILRSIYVIISILKNIDNRKTVHSHVRYNISDKIVPL